MSEEQRRTEWPRLSIPIRVIGASPEAGQFMEDTHTVAVNQAGARIALKHTVAAGETIRIINLENYNEADFRVVGPTAPPGSAEREWGVECVEQGRNIWGVELPPPLSAEVAEAGTLLECRACHQRGLVAVTLMEVEVLGSTGLVVRECNKCAKPTYWVYAETTRRPREISPTEPVAPAVRGPAAEKRTDKRTHKRVGMKLPILVTNQKNEQEVAKTENISKGGVAVSLVMELAVGEMLTTVCPYDPEGQKIEQKAEVRWRSPFPFGGLRTYGLCYRG
jgi:hypothetical protein